MKRTKKEQLSINDFQGLQPSMRGKNVTEEVQHVYDKQGRRNLIRAILRSLGKEYLLMTIGTLVASAFEYSSPFIV